MPWLHLLLARCTVDRSVACRVVLEGPIGGGQRQQRRAEEAEEGAAA